MMGEDVTVGSTTVGNVLVEPGLSKDATDIERPAGARVDYTLRFPCGSDAPENGAKVTVRGTELDVLNVPDHWHGPAVFGSWSNPWDMTVLVGRALGDFTATVKVLQLVASVDALGDPQVTPSSVYDGPAQARMKDGATADGETVETLPTEVWEFVVPWSAALGSMRPQSTRIEYGGAQYRVRSVTNVDNKSEFLTFEATRLAERAHASSGIVGA